MYAGVRVASLPSTSRPFDALLPLTHDMSNAKPLYDDNLCLLRAISLANLIDANPTVPVKHLLFKLNMPTTRSLFQMDRL